MSKKQKKNFGWAVHSIVGDDITYDTNGEVVKCMLLIDYQSRKCREKIKPQSTKRIFKRISSKTLEQIYGKGHHKRAKCNI